LKNLSEKSLRRLRNYTSRPLPLAGASFFGDTGGKAEEMQSAKRKMQNSAFKKKVLAGSILHSAF
jgi:hypothetical protein